MAFFDEVAKKVGDVAQTVGNKGRDIADITTNFTALFNSP